VATTAATGSPTKHAVLGERARTADYRQRRVRRVGWHGGIGAAEVSAREDTDHPRRPPGRRAVHAPEAGVGMGRAEDRHVKAAGDPQVVDELARAGDEPGILATADDGTSVFGHELGAAYCALSTLPIF
jgi:hypothetical protein